MRAKIKNNREDYVTRAKKASRGAGLSFKEKLAASGVHGPIKADEYEEHIDEKWYLVRKKKTA